ncbi:tyrosine-type recombinase/integrase [Paraburkholderia tuberum]|uniref:Site-specific recombinase XerD n=1 Tax=Paraburkholderia tuberum TaxID=157910 RepID=A0A1H1K0T1_9BURK|nr:tyrosine-type recombinase/integrase [Paraburkholderia tuberum]SDR55856.1 Site-specific recombinase XerD [Paraburkholderia tuberum]
MSHPSRVRVTGPLASFKDGFAAALREQGYRPNSAANQLQLLGHLSRWLASRRLDAMMLTAPILGEFLDARRAQGYTLWLSTKALVPLISYLGSIGIQVASTPAALSPSELLLSRYHRYLLDVRGLVATSARGYVDMVRPFVEARVVDSDLNWKTLQAKHVIDFVLATRDGRPTGSAKLTGAALRSLLTYLHIEGFIAQPLAMAVPSVAGWRLAGLPRALEAGDVQRFLAACDRRTHSGRRDFAMLTLLARLGLRAGEVARLDLADIDWRAGELVVRGKGQRVERLPLPADVGDALAAYLQHGRPNTAQCRTVFLRIRAPHKALSSTGVTDAVAAAASRAGLDRVRAHRLRHTLASQMVCSGVALPAVSQVLRHRRLLTTAIYAKVDRQGLRLVARAWPGSAT